MPGMLRGMLTVHPLTVEIHDSGLALAERYGFATYDAMIVAAALQTGCNTPLSEDMQDGMALEEGLRIVNPFRGSSIANLRKSVLNDKLVRSMVTQCHVRSR